MVLELKGEELEELTGGVEGGPEDRDGPGEMGVTGSA